jgi:hypothetical protein
VTDVQNSTLESIDEIETNGNAYGGVTAEQDALLRWLLVCREALVGPYEYMARYLQPAGRQMRASETERAAYAER